MTPMTVNNKQQQQQQTASELNNSSLSRDILISTRISSCRFEKPNTIDEYLELGRDPSLIEKCNCFDQEEIRLES
jgi:hypothetical protein